MFTVGTLDAYSDGMNMTRMLLNLLLNHPAGEIRLADYVIYLGESTLWARHDRSLVSPDFRPTVAGMACLMRWIECHQAELSAELLTK